MPPFPPSRPTASPPQASTSRLLISSSFHSSTSPLPRAFRLTPATRTRLTNLTFITAAALSMLTVSLGMSGSIKAGGVELPCPARRGAGVGLQEEQGKKEGWGASFGSGKGRKWLEDPTPVVKSAPAQATPPPTPLRRSKEVEETERPRTMGRKEVVAEGGEGKSGWFGGLWRS